MFTSGRRAGRSVRHGVTAAVVGAIVLTASLPASAGPRGARSHTATRRMTISASDSVYTSLSIPVPVRLALDYGEEHPGAPAFSEGKGLAALLLVPEADGSTTFGAIRLPEGAGAVRRVVSMGPQACQLEAYCIVPRGDYKLYVLTERRVTIEVELQGLQGASRLTPRTPANAGIEGAAESYLHSTPDGPVEMAVHGAGFAPSLTGRRNLLFSAFWFRGSDETIGPSPADQPLLQVGTAGSCLYEQEAPPAGAYAPGCPGGKGAGSFSNAKVLSPYGFLLWNALANIPPGTYGRGYYAVHTGIREPGFVGFWLDLTSE